MLPRHNGALNGVTLTLLHIVLTEGFKMNPVSKYPWITNFKYQFIAGVQFLHIRTNSACHKVEIFTASEADRVLQLTGSEDLKVMNTL
jgi:hypothetical protein